MNTKINGILVPIDGCVLIKPERITFDMRRNDLNFGAVIALINKTKILGDIEYETFSTDNGDLIFSSEPIKLWNLIKIIDNLINFEQYSLTVNIVSITNE